MSAEHANDPFHHVRDSNVFELPQFLDGLVGRHVFALPSFNLFGYDFQLTKFMVLQVVAGLLTLAVFRSLSRQIASGKPAQGVWANFWELVALYVRDTIVRPTLGDHDHHHEDQMHGHGPEVGSPQAIAAAHPEDRFLPFIWTCFFYILFCNLLGAVPWLGSPTGSINVTGALVLTAFGVTVMTGSAVFGVVGFWKNDSPGRRLPPLMKIFWCRCCSGSKSSAC